MTKPALVCLAVALVGCRDAAAEHRKRLARAQEEAKPALELMAKIAAAKPAAGLPDCQGAGLAKPIAVMRWRTAVMLGTGTRTDTPSFAEPQYSTTLFRGEPSSCNNIDSVRALDDPFLAKDAYHAASNLFEIAGCVADARSVAVLRADRWQAPTSTAGQSHQGGFVEATLLGFDMNGVPRCATPLAVKSPEQHTFLVRPDEERDPERLRQRQLGTLQIDLEDQMRLRIADTLKLPVHESVVRKPNP